MRLCPAPLALLLSALVAGFAFSPLAAAQSPSNTKPGASQSDEDGEEDEEGDEGEADGEGEDDEEAAQPRPPRDPSERVRWGKKPFVRPAVGASLFNDGSQTYTTVALGAQAGLNVWQEKPDPKVVGTTRVLGQYIIGAGSSGYEVRVGAFAGPWYKVVGLRTGPDIFHNQYSFGAIDLAPTTGLSWPVIALLDFKVINLYGGVEPAFFFSSDRPGVDWGAEPSFGFGSEFTYLTGIGLDVDAFGVSLSYTDRITAFGHQKGFGIGFRVGG